jgi:nucleoside-diphosphate-sugar epimerase
MTQRSKIFVADHRGMVGSAIVRQLEAKGDADIIVRSRQELDLTCQQDVRNFFASEKSDQVYIAAAIAELANAVAEAVGYRGRIVFDNSTYADYLRVKK